MKKLQIILLTIVFICMIIILSPATTGRTQVGNLDEYALAELAFQATTAELEGIDSITWAEASWTEPSWEKQEQFVEKLLDDLGYNKNDAEFSKEKYEDYLLLSAAATVEEGLLLQISVQSNTKLQESNTYFVISLSSKSDSQSFRKKYRRIIEIMEVSADSNKNRKLVQFTGSYAGNLARAVEREQIRHVLHCTNASRVTGIDEETMLSVTAKSPLSALNRDIFGRKANLQIALRYHSFDNRTYISIGVPLLDGEI